MGYLAKAARSRVADFRAFFSLRKKRDRLRSRLAAGPLLSRSAVSLFFVATISLNVGATAVPALVASYNDAQARIPQPLAASPGLTSALSNVPAADAHPDATKALKLTQAYRDKLGD